IVSRSPVLFNSIRYAGAAYLAYLGLRLIFARVAAADAEDPALPRGPESGWSMMRRGFWVNILNPKAIVLFAAFTPQVIRLARPALPQYLSLIATVAAVDLMVMWGFSATAARPFQRVTRTPRGQRVLNIVFGVLFLAVAALLF